MSQLRTRAIIALRSAAVNLSFPGIPSAPSTCGAISQRCFDERRSVPGIGEGDFFVLAAKPFQVIDCAGNRGSDTGVLGKIACQISATHDVDVVLRSGCIASLNLILFVTLNKPMTGGKVAVARSPRIRNCAQSWRTSNASQRRMPLGTGDRLRQPAGLHQILI